jgi:hypothetical protein
VQGPHGRLSLTLPPGSCTRMCWRGAATNPARCCSAPPTTAWRGCACGAQAETTLINFTVTEGGLEDQLLALVVNRERADLEEAKGHLIAQNSEFVIKLKQLEDGLLEKLSAAQGDLTENGGAGAGAAACGGNGCGDLVWGLLPPAVTRLCPCGCRGADRPAGGVQGAGRRNLREGEVGRRNLREGWMLVCPLQHSTPISLILWVCACRLPSNNPRGSPLPTHSSYTRSLMIRACPPHGAPPTAPQVVEARETEARINEARNVYRGVAARGSALFFLLNSLGKMHAFYQYSLGAFVVSAGQRGGNGRGGGGGGGTKRPAGHAFRGARRLEGRGCAHGQRPAMGWCNRGYGPKLHGLIFI